MSAQVFRCTEPACDWHGTEPSWSDSRPLELKADQFRTPQTMIPVCPYCLGDVAVVRAGEEPA